nr:hypothetical protein [Streptomyces sp. YPW6]
MRPLHTALTVLIVAVRGVNFVASEVGLGHFPLLLFSALRFPAAALPAVFLVGRPAVDEGAGGPVLAFVLVVGAAACWGASNVLTRRAVPRDALTFMVWVSAVPVLPLLGGVALASGVGMRTGASRPEAAAAAPVATGAGEPATAPAPATASGPPVAAGARVRRRADPAAPPPPGASASRTPSTPRCPDPARPGTPPAAAPRSPAAAE